MSLCSAYLAADIHRFLSDFTHQRLSALGSDGDSPIPTPLLREWAKAKLTRDLWRDALLSAAGVSISFCSHTHCGIDTPLVCSLHFPGSRSTRSYVNVSK